MLLVIEQTLLLFRRVLIDFSLNDHIVFLFLIFFVFFYFIYLLVLCKNIKYKDIILCFILCLFCIFNTSFFYFPLLILLALIIEKYSIKFYASINVILIITFIGILFIFLFLGIIENKEHYYLHKTSSVVYDLGLRSANNFPTYIIFLEMFVYLLIYDFSYKKKMFFLSIFFVVTMVVYDFCGSRGGVIAMITMGIAELCSYSLRKIILKKLDYIILIFLLLSIWTALYGSQNNEINQLMSTRPRCWLMFIQDFSFRDYLIGDIHFNGVSELGYNVDSSYLILLGRNGILGYCIVWYLTKKTIALNLNFLVEIFPVIALVLLTSFFESYFYGIGISTLLLARLTLPINNEHGVIRVSSVNCTHEGNVAQNFNQSSD